MSSCVATNGFAGTGKRGTRVQVDVANLSPAEAVFLVGVIDLLTDPLNWPARDLLTHGNLTIHVSPEGIEAGPTVSTN